MHINCNCGFQLTANDLRYKKYWGRFTTVEKAYYMNGDLADPVTMTTYYIKPGTFLYNRTDVYNRPSPRVLVCHEDLVENIVPKFEEGMGCCNVSGCKLYCPSCNTKLGQADIDCWQDQRVELISKKITRVY